MFGNVVLAFFTPQELTESQKSAVKFDEHEFFKLLI